MPRHVIETDTTYHKNAFTTVNAATYTILSTDRTVHVTYSSTGTCVITLPTAATFAGGTEITIKDAGFNASQYNITINPNGVETIEDESSLVVTGDGESFVLYSDGSGAWFVK